MADLSVSENELLALIADGESRLSPKQRRLWERIKIVPEKWQAGEYGDETSGFWVVGMFGHQVLWYNEIEEGFGVTPFTKFGYLDTLHYETDDLAIPVRRLMRFIDDGLTE